MSESRGDVTQLLEAAMGGNTDAKSELLAVAYEELRALAGRFMQAERADHTLQPTALVNEAALRLLRDPSPMTGRHRAWFFGAMAQTMRRVLIDHARKRNAERRQGSWQRAPLDAVLDNIESTHHLDIVALDDALQQLEQLNSRQAAVVEHRFFGGSEMADIAERLGVSLSTVENDWRIARAWLKQQFAEDVP